MTQDKDRWLFFTHSDPAIRDNPDVRDWLDEAGRLTQDQVERHLRDFAAFGIATIHIGDLPLKVLPGGPAGTATFIQDGKVVGVVTNIEEACETCGRPLEHLFCTGCYEVDCECEPIPGHTPQTKSGYSSSCSR